MNRLLLIGLVLFVACTDTKETVFNKEALTAELISATNIEQEAFMNGDCETVKNAFNDDAEIYLNGNRLPSLDMLYNFCNKVPRPFNKPGKEELHTFVQTPTSGYTIKVMNLEDKDSLGNYTKEVITKVFHKIDDAWKIVHMNSSISKANDQQGPPQQRNQ